jgi:hypothetical protein
LIQKRIIGMTVLKNSFFHMNTLQLL